MIFVTLGSQKFQFNRLLESIDKIIITEGLTEKIFAQIGYSDYKPKNYEYIDFLDREAFARKMNDADIVITHGGTGAIITAVKSSKKVIAIPRLRIYGEHVDDHQLQLVKQFEDLNLISVCLDCNDLKKYIAKIKNTEFNSYQSNTKRIMDNIEQFFDCI